MAWLWLLIPILIGIGAIVIAYFQLRRPISQITFEEAWNAIASPEDRTITVNGRVSITTIASGIVLRKATCKIKWNKKTFELHSTKWSRHLLYPNTRIAEFQIGDVDVPETEAARLEVFIELEDGARKRMKQRLTFVPASQTETDSNAP